MQNDYNEVLMNRVWKSKNQWRSTGSTLGLNSPEIQIVLHIHGNIKKLKAIHMNLWKWMKYYFTLECTKFHNLCQKDQKGYFYRLKLTRGFVFFVLCTVNYCRLVPIPVLENFLLNHRLATPLARPSGIDTFKLLFNNCNFSRERRQFKKR